MRSKRVWGLAALVAVLFVSVCASAQQKTFTLTKQGVGCVKMGMKYAQLPAKCDGLYTSVKKEVIENEMDGDYTQYVFYNGTTKVMSSNAYTDAVKNLTTYTPLVKATNGMYAGMPAVELYNHRAKINTNHEFYFETGIYQFSATLSESGYKKANNDYLYNKPYVIAPTDFPKGAKIESMTVWIE